MKTEEKTEVKKIVLGVLKEEERKSLKKKEEEDERKGERNERIELVVFIACFAAGIGLLIHTLLGGYFHVSFSRFIGMFGLSLMLLAPLTLLGILYLWDWCNTGSWTSKPEE